MDSTVTGFVASPMRGGKNSAAGGRSFSTSTGVNEIRSPASYLASQGCANTSRAEGRLVASLVSIFRRRSMQESLTAMPSGKSTNGLQQGTVSVLP